MKKSFLLILVSTFLISHTIFAFDYIDRTITSDEINSSRVLMHSNERLLIPYYMMGGLFGDWFTAQTVPATSPGTTTVYIINDYFVHNLDTIAVVLIQSSWGLFNLPSIAGVDIAHHRGVSSYRSHLDITIIPAE